MKVYEISSAGYPKLVNLKSVKKIPFGPCEQLVILQEENGVKLRTIGIVDEGELMLIKKGRNNSNRECLVVINMKITRDEWLQCTSQEESKSFLFYYMALPSLREETCGIEWRLGQNLAPYSSWEILGISGPENIGHYLLVLSIVIDIDIGTI
jgi:hypothetical protein